MVGRPIYGHLHAAQHDGDLICSPFYVTTPFAAVKSVQATTSTTISVEKKWVKLCLTGRSGWYNRRRDGLPDNDRYESQQLIR